MRTSCITTTAAVASLDLVKDNDYVFKPKDTKALVDIIKKYIENPNLLSKHSKNSLKIIKDFSFENSKKEIERIIKDYKYRRKIKDA